MSTLGRICRNNEAPVAKNETGRKQKLCRDKGSSVTTLIIATWKSLLRHEKSFKEKPLSRQGNVCRDAEEEETLVAIDKQGRDK